MTRYDSIGRTYTATRRADPRIASRVTAALGRAASVVNVGAGTGNYEPDDRFVVAVDPSLTMLQQRAAGTASAVQSVAEAMPFSDGAFDVALAVLTVHHWDDLEAGLREMQRVAARQVIFFYEPSAAWTLWLVPEYFPEILDLASERAAPGLDRLAASLAVQDVEPVLVPADCSDGFAGCYWNRPEAYLDPAVQDGMSALAQLDPVVRKRGTDRLRLDLERGDWDERHGELRDLTEIDLGYRLLLAGDHLS
ncbi:MAG TPA: methyltransferase domain-containing protein [Acidimicrobiia bacterium]|nr:methyltransferase domain-containing protein [Acidimicrobiia bacterium]